MDRSLFELNLFKQVILRIYMWQVNWAYYSDWSKILCFCKVFSIDY
jgi:hypothetical protein